MKGKFVIVTILTLILISMFTAVQASNNLYVGPAPGGADTGNCQTEVLPCATIGYAISQASANDVIILQGNIIEGMVVVNIAITLDGDGNTLTSTSASYGISIQSPNVTIKNITVDDAGTFGIHQQPNNGGLTIENTTVTNGGGTGFALNCSANITLQNITSTGNTGNGVSITNSQDVTINGITTSGNAFGGGFSAGIGIFSNAATCMPDGTDAITLTGTVNIAEPTPVYEQITTGTITHVNLPAAFTHYLGLAGSKFYYTALQDALAAADATLLLDPAYRPFVYVKEVDGTNFYVAPAVSATVNMSIQAAVNAAQAGDTINVAEGTYVEQVVIEKALTLQGMGADKPVIQAPPAVSRVTRNIPETARTFNPILFIDGGAGLIEVTINGFEFDGQNDPGAGNFIGILARNVAPGLIVNNDLHSLMDGQETLGISVYGADSEVTVAGNTVTDFSRNGITIVEAAQADVADNVVIGRGYVGTGFWAQNGIQLYQVASAIVSGNTLSEIGWIWPGAGDNWSATGILIWENEGITLVEENELTDVQIAIRFISASFEAVGNIVEMADSGPLAYTGGIWGNPQGRPETPAYPFDAPVGQAAVMSNGDPELSFHYENNTVIGDGAVAGWGIAIWPYTGPDVEVVAVGNTVNSWDIGFDIWGGDVFTATINQNQIVGNNYGLYNWTATEVDARLNWWGSPCDPGSLIEGPADYSPWWGDPIGSYLVDAATTSFVVPDGATTAEANAILACVPANGTVNFEADGLFEGGIVVNTPGLTINLNGGAVGAGSPAFTIAAADVTIQGPGALAGNGIDPGVLVVAGGDNFTLKDVEVRDWAAGVAVDADVISFNLFDNWIHSNAGAGLQINSGFTLGGVVSIQGNLFKENGIGINHEGNGTLPATYNSWGDVTGPYNEDDNNTGLGDGVSANVTFAPWTFAEIYLDVDPDNDAILRNVNEGDSFDVALKAEAANLYGLSFVFSYDDDLLTRIITPTFSAPWVDACFAMTGLAANEIGYQCALTDPTPEWNGGTIATFNLTANGAGLLGDGPWSALFDISHEVADTSAGAVGGAKVFVNNAGFNAPSDPDRNIADANDGEIVITGLANFTGFVNLQGRPNNSGALVQVFDVADKATATLLAEGTSALSGAYTTAYVGANQLYVDQTYWIQIDRPLFLPTTIMATTGLLPAVPDDWAHSAVLLVRPLTTLNMVLLLGGDATNSNYIDIGDATCIGANYGSTTPGVCGVDGTSDVNNDGIVNILDLTLMGGNFEKNSSPWVPQNP
jgi:nitrous oxidase accessory protein NosD